MTSETLPALSQDDHDVALSHLAGATWQRLNGHRLFITGGTGFVGVWLLSTLLEARRRHGFDCEITLLTRDPVAFANRAPQLASARHVHLLQGDVIDFGLPSGTFDLILHAATDVVAGSTPLRIFETCLAGTRRVLDLARQAGTRRILIVSSGAVYGRQPPDLQALSEGYAGAPDTMAPAMGYGQGKRAAEWLAAAYGAQHGIDVVSARLFAFVGPAMPLDSRFAIGNFIRDALAGVPIVIQGDGTPWRSYLHAADMAGWLWKIALDGTAGEAYNVGGEEAVTVASLAERITAVVGSEAGVQIRGSHTPGAAAERYVPDVSKAREALGLGAVLSLDEGIERTARWYRQARRSS